MARRMSSPKPSASTRAPSTKRARAVKPSAGKASGPNEAANGKGSRSGESGGKKDDRRRQILKAAVRVFAERGYHGCRISDIAEEAGVAYGLVYHYFGNKDGLLRTIFETNWALFASAMERISAAKIPPSEKVAGFIDWMVGSYALTPEVIKVLLLEFARSSRLGDALEDPELSKVFRVFSQTFAEAQKAGELSAAIDPEALGFIFFGAAESGLVQVVLPQDGKPLTKKKEAQMLERLRVTLRGLFAPNAPEGAAADIIAQMSKPPS